MPAYSNVARVTRAAAFSAMLAALLTTLTGCSEYLARRDGITLNAGNAVMADRVTHMVDPWPRASANRDIAFNGDRMEEAFKRYRTGNVIQPVGINTGTAYQAAPATAAPAVAAPVGPTVTSPPVK
jgi:hypothetical protein